MHTTVWKGCASLPQVITKRQSDCIHGEGRRAAWPAVSQPEIYWWDCDFLIMYNFHTYPGKSVFLPSAAPGSSQGVCRGSMTDVTAVGVVQWRSRISFSLSSRDMHLTHFFPWCHPGISKLTQICQASRSLPVRWEGGGCSTAWEGIRTNVQHGFVFTLKRQKYWVLQQKHKPRSARWSVWKSAV